MTYKKPCHIHDGSSSAEETESNPDDGDLAIFFSDTSLQRFSALERKRLRNLKLNYEMLTSMGLLVEKPDFMKSKTKRFCQEDEEVKWKGDNSDPKDPEWTPSMDWVELPTRSRRVKPARKSLRKAKLEVSEQDVQDEMTFSLGLDTPQEVPSPPLTRPSNKLWRFIPEDEQELYCEDCGLDYLEECPFHGPLTIVKNTKTTSEGREHAWHTLPACLSIWPSKIPGAGLGVWTNELIQKRTRFGPYEGDMITDWDRAEASGYCWKIGQGDLFVDAKNQETSNWLRYVNCCRSLTEQNLLAYQYRGQIYYRTIVDVPPDTELLVWYGDDYGRELGVKQDQAYNSFFYPHKRKSASLDSPYRVLSESDSKKQIRRKHRELQKDNSRKMEGETNPPVKEEFERSLGVNSEWCKEDPRSHSNEGKLTGNTCKSSLSPENSQRTRSGKKYSCPRWSRKCGRLSVPPQNNISSCSKIGESSVSTEKSGRTHLRNEYFCPQWSQKSGKSSVPTEKKVTSSSEANVSNVTTENNLVTRSGKKYPCAQLTRHTCHNSMKRCSRKEDCCVQMRGKPRGSSLPSGSTMRSKASQEHKNTLSESVRWMQRKTCVPCVVLLECLRMKPVPKGDCPLESPSNEKSTEKRVGDLQDCGVDVTSKMDSCQKKRINLKRHQSIHSMTEGGVQGKSLCLEQDVEYVKQIKGTRNLRRQSMNIQIPSCKGNKVCPESVQTADKMPHDEILSSIQDEPKRNDRKGTVESSTDDNVGVHIGKEEIKEELKTVDNVLLLKDNGIDRLDASGSTGVDCKRETQCVIDTINSVNKRDFSLGNREESCKFQASFLSENVWLFYSSLNLDCGFEKISKDSSEEMSEVFRKGQCIQTGWNSCQIGTGGDCPKSKVCSSFDEDCFEWEMDCDSRCCVGSQRNPHFIDCYRGHPVHSECECCTNGQMEDSGLHRYKYYPDKSCRINDESCFDQQMESWYTSDLECYRDNFGPFVSSDHTKRNDLAHGHHINPLWQIYTELNKDIQDNISNLLKQLIY